MASTPNDGDHYIIINAASNSCLDLNNGSKSNGTSVQGWGQNFRSDTIKNQIWRMRREDRNSPFFKLFNKASDTVLDLNDGSDGNGTRIQGWGSADVENQLWQFEKATGPAGGPPLFLIRNKMSKTVMDLNNGNPRDGTKVQGWAKADNDNQKWVLMKVDI